MRIIIARKIKFKQDGLTSAVFVGTDEKRSEKIVIENCYQIAPLWT